MLLCCIITILKWNIGKLCPTQPSPASQNNHLKHQTPNFQHGQHSNNTVWNLINSEIVDMHKHNQHKINSLITSNIKEFMNDGYMTSRNIYSNRCKITPNTQPHSPQSGIGWFPSSHMTSHPISTFNTFIDNPPSLAITQHDNNFIIWGRISK